MKKITIPVFCCLVAACSQGSESISPGPEDAEVPAETLQAEEPNPALLIPSLARDEAPSRVQVRFETTKGEFTVALVRDWAPIGVDRFFNLVRIGFFNDVAFYRVLKDSLVQFGVNGDPEINSIWATEYIQDDPVKESNKRGYLGFAMAGPNTRTTQVFVNLVDNLSLDQSGFAPIGQVTDGMPVLDSIYSGYGEPAPKGKGPLPRLLNMRGNAYLKRDFPELDYILTASLTEE